MKLANLNKLNYLFLLSGLLLCSSFKAQATLYNTSYSYDVPNGITVKTDPNGKRIRYTYDVVNRLSKVELLDTTGIPTFNYTYDLTDQLTSITYPGGSQTYTYDDFDRLQTIRDFGQTNPLLTFSYDHQDRITWITYLSNGAVCYEYDPDGRITRVGRVLPGNSATVCSSANEKTNYIYDSKGRLKTITYPNGIQSFTEYDAYTGQVKTAGHRRANGALIYSDTFAYYPNSPLYQSITRKTLTDSKTTQYTWDAYERVKTITEADGRTTVYTYDAFGNRLTETITGSGGAKPAGTYVYQYATGSNRLGSILFNGATQETFAYNNAGRITQRVHSTNGTTTYTWDDRGLLTGVTKPGITATFTYDALGVRKTRTVNSVTTHYLTAPIFGMSHVLGELDTSLNFKATYVYGGTQQLKEEPVASDRTKDLYLLHDGIVGSITHAIDLNGSIRNEHKYDAFGIRTPQSAATTGSLNHYGYTGEEYDQETGLVYLRARYYDPTLGRFISADPYLGRIEEPVTQNRYIYVQNNPLMYTDPSGLDSFHVCRPLESVLGAVAAHCFVVSDAEWIGDTNAIVHSFGDKGNGMLGKVDINTHGISETTWSSDKDYWRSLSGGTVPNSSTQLTGSTVSVINAADSSVRYFANSLEENLSYSLMFGVNSNAAAYAIAYSVDSTFTGANGSLLKPTATNWRNITFDVEMCTK